MQHGLKSTAVGVTSTQTVVSTVIALVNNTNSTSEVSETNSTAVLSNVITTTVKTTNTGIKINLSLLSEKGEQHYKHSKKQKESKALCKRSEST